MIAQILFRRYKMKQRSTLAIVSLILQSAVSKKEGATKNRIIRDVVLTYKRANRYCDMMVKKGLLMYGKESRTYLLTPKGLEVLQSSREMLGYLSHVQRMVDRYKVYDENSIDHKYNVNYYYPTQH
jgi:predicted transcriptional regulator